MSKFDVLHVTLKEINNVWTVVILCHDKEQQESLLTHLTKDDGYNFSTFIPDSDNNDIIGIISLDKIDLAISFPLILPDKTANPKDWVDANVRHLVVGFLDKTHLLANSPVLSLEPKYPDK